MPTNSNTGNSINQNGILYPENGQNNLVDPTKVNLATVNTNTYEIIGGSDASLPPWMRGIDATTGGGAVTVNTNVSSYGRIFKSFNSSTDIVKNNKQTATEGVWSTGIGGILTTFHTSSAQTAQNGNYFINVNQYATSSTESEIQFAVAYGHYAGSGSAEINSSAGTTGVSYSKSTYYQFGNILLPSITDLFQLKDGTTMSQFIAISFARERFKEQLDPGNWQISFGTGSNVQTFRDDYTAAAYPTVGEGGPVYNVISGSITGGVVGSNYIGLMYPKHGVILLDATKLSLSSSVAIQSGSSGTTTGSPNLQIAYKHISGSAVVNSVYGFQARNSQEITSTFYFVRVYNSEFNYSNNPSFTSGSQGDFRYTEMIYNPNVYMSSIGLYNDNKELLAVAKLSQPILKTFTNEVNINVKLDW